MKYFEMNAAALYDGGWRSTDRDQLMSEYGLTPEEADGICEVLAELEQVHAMFSEPDDAETYVWELWR